MAEERTGSDLQTVLDGLDDPECRAILRSLAETSEQSVSDLAERCELSRTSAYRKVGLLEDAGLVDAIATVREDGHHTTVYSAAFDGVYIGLGDDGFDVSVDRTEPPDERLARFWETMKNSR